MPADYLPFLFLAISIVFFIVSFRNRTDSEGRPNSARKAGLRIAITFAIVAVAVGAMRILLR